MLFGHNFPGLAVSPLLARKEMGAGAQPLLGMVRTEIWLDDMSASYAGLDHRSFLLSPICHECPLVLSDGHNSPGNGGAGV